jgi:hypothetical protein
MGLRRGFHAKNDFSALVLNFGAASGICPQSATKRWISRHRMETSENSSFLFVVSGKPV